jgi:DNA-binding beta-propeller fold protein YncE
VLLKIPVFRGEVSDDIYLIFDETSNHHMKKLVFVIAVLAAVYSCKEDDKPDPIPSLTFGATTLSCQVGSTKACANIATSSIPAGGAISYTSSNVAVATVDGNSGAITALTAGTTTITATQVAKPGANASAAATYSLTIIAADPTPTLTFAEGPYACEVGSITACTWTATSSIPAGGAITYSISPATAGTINATTGAVTPAQAGIATVTATQAASEGKNAAATATYTLTITGLSITSFAPTFGGVDYEVVITGTKFDGTTAANNHVFINGVQTAVPTNISSTSLTVRVPQGATGGGDIKVIVGAQTATKGTFTEYATVTTLAGDGTQGFQDDTGMKAKFHTPGHLALDNDGNILVADYANSAVRSVTVDGVTTTVADNSDGFAEPWGITVDKSTGLVYVADRSTNLIKKINLSNGNVTTYAGSTYDGDGHDDGTNLTDVQFDQPHGLVVDGFGNIWMTDRWFCLVREIVSGSHIFPVGGDGTSGFENGSGSNTEFYFPDGIVIDPNGDFILVADATNNAIRKISIQGVIETTSFVGGTPENNSSGSADGTGSAAKFSSPAGMAMDAAGNTYVADYGNNQIRKVTPAGVVTTIAGMLEPGDGGYHDDLGPFAKIYAPWGITVTPDGSAIYVADGTNRIRKIVP